METQAIRMTARARPPRPEELSLRFSERAIKELETILRHYPDRKSAMLPALWIAQREYGGYLPRKPSPRSPIGSDAPTPK
jgi:NADH:ubiquinone oxidoreductase subunit E